MLDTIGQRIRYVREEILELSGEEFGKLLNVTKTAVSNWEKGNRTADIHTLSKIAELGNVTLDYLACKTNDPNAEVVSYQDGNKVFEVELEKGTKEQLTEGQLQALIKKLEAVNFDVEKLIDKIKEEK